MIELSAKQTDFIENLMCISMQHLNEKVSASPLKQHTDLIDRYISQLVDASIEKQGHEKIKDIYVEYSQIATCPHLCEFFETIWHVFSVFSKGGLHDLFIYQQNEDWYPRILLKRELKPNDISSLGDTITVYRGCNFNEFNQKRFGQSWTTDKKIARQFAFHHYANQAWFKTEDRIILQATINKKDIYYSDQVSSEKEISVNPEKLNNVAICV